MTAGTWEGREVKGQYKVANGERRGRTWPYRRSAGSLGRRSATLRRDVSR